MPGVCPEFGTNIISSPFLVRPVLSKAEGKGVRGMVERLFQNPARRIAKSTP